MIKVTEGSKTLCTTCGNLFVWYSNIGWILFFHKITVFSVCKSKTDQQTHC